MSNLTLSQRERLSRLADEAMTRELAERAMRRAEESDRRDLWITIGGASLAAVAIIGMVVAVLYALGVGR